MNLAADLSLYYLSWYLGSFYDNSKIENPNEFDLNIVLDLNGLGISYEIVRLDGCPPGYIMIQVHAVSDYKKRSYKKR